MSQSPETAAQESEDDDTRTLIVDEYYPRTKVVKVKKKKTRRKLRTDIENIPGVRKIVLGEISQKVIECVVGEHVTSEKPWAFVDKENIMSNLELHAESSEFLPIKSFLDVFPRNEVLMGYIPDESRDFDEFFICTTEAATDTVKLVIEQQRLELEKRLQASVIKDVGLWTSQGTEKEIDECSEKPSRPLLEVEIESRYPILPFKVRFCKKKCEEMRDGYMELHSVDPSVVYINRKRIDNFTQVAPFLVPNEVQTDCKYPTNEACQYQYEVEIPKEIDFQPFIAHWQENLDTFLEVLISNTHLDLYMDDYKKLRTTVIDQNILYFTPPREHLSFVDVNICKGKHISAVKWHPLWSGVAAIAYVDICSKLWVQNPEMDENVNRLVHKMNPVLLWSFADDLKPKLVLETHREVTSLSFCPFDENILLGGCSNGQIIIWDLKDRLRKVEERQILTVAQQKYKRYMFSLMHWMKNVFDISLVKPTVITQLEYSHKGPVFSLEWFPPYYKYSKTGKVQYVEPPNNSLQFISSSEDGTLLIWDLHSKPPATALRGPGKLHRVKAKPMGEIPEQSPYKLLNLNLKPIYKINVTGDVGGRLAPIASIGHKNFYLNIVKKQRKKEDLRDTYDVIFDAPPYCSNQNEAYVGTMEGSFLHIKWEGQQFDSGEVVNKENCFIKNCGTYHDGPITSVSISPVSNTILTVGGKIFALWRQDFRKTPILWRKGTCIYTYGVWYIEEPAKIRLLRMDGFVEVWILCYNSNKPLYTILVSTGPITTTSTASIPYDGENIFGFADHSGCFRSYIAAARSEANINNDNDKMNKYIAREIERKKMLLKWQKEWNEKYNQELLKEKMEREQSTTAIEEPPIRTKSAIHDPSTQEIKKEKSKVLDQPAQRHIEAIKREQQIRMEEEIRETVFERKQIRKEQLEIDSIPLKKAEEEAEIRRRKQRKRIIESEKVFKETITMLFPDVVKEKPPPPVDPHVTGHLNFDKEGCYNYYKNNVATWKKYVEKHDFKYVFNWKRVLDAGEERRKKVTGHYNKTTHWKRAEQTIFDDKPSVDESKPSIRTSTSTILADPYDTESDIDEITLQ